MKQTHKSTSLTIRVGIYQEFFFFLRCIFLGECPMYVLEILDMSASYMLQVLCQRGVNKCKILIPKEFSLRDCYRDVSAGK